jgi:hypothetical protein
VEAQATVFPSASNTAIILALSLSEALGLRVSSLSQRFPIPEKDRNRSTRYNGVPPMIEEVQIYDYRK